MDNINVLIIGDPHIRTNEVEYTDLMLKEILMLARTEKFDFIVVLGDTLHTHNKVDIDPLSRAVEWLGELSDIAHLYLMIGNHDIRNPKVNLVESEKKVHPFTALKRWKNTTVVDDLVIDEVKGMKFCFTPFIPEGEYHRVISKVDTKEIKCFFSHNNFYGVRYKLGDDPAECPDVWPEDYPLMIAGHNHEYQIVRSNLVYVGTPGQQDFGASPDKAVVTWKFSSEIASCNDMTRKPLVTIPLRTIHIFKASELAELCSLLEDLKTSKRTRLVKIKIRGTRAELHTITKSHVYTELKSLKGVVIHDEPMDEEIEKPIITIESKPTSSFEEIVRDVLKGNPDLLNVFNTLSV